MQYQLKKAVSKVVLYNLVQTLICQMIDWILTS